MSTHDIRPIVTSPGARPQCPSTGTKLCCLVTRARVGTTFPRSVAWKWNGRKSNPRPFESWGQSPNNYITRPCTQTMPINNRRCTCNNEKIQQNITNISYTYMSNTLTVNTRHICQNMLNNHRFSAWSLNQLITKQEILLVKYQILHCTYNSRMLIFCGSCFFLFRASRSFFLLINKIQDLRNITTY